MHVHTPKWTLTPTVECWLVVLGLPVLCDSNSVYQAISGGGENRNNKIVQQPPPTPNASTAGSCPTLNL